MFQKNFFVKAKSELAKKQTQNLLFLNIFLFCSLLILISALLNFLVVPIRDNVHTDNLTTLQKEIVGRTIRVSIEYININNKSEF